MDYPRKLNLAHLADNYPAALYPGTAEVIRAWNLGLIEFLYLVPVNLVLLWLAFRPSKRMPAGFIAVATGALYAPVRFFLDFLRPEDTDPRYASLTFAQWASIVAFGGSLYVASRILKSGAPAETVAPTSREAQERLRIILRDDEETNQKQDADKKSEAERKQAMIAKLRAERDQEDAELAAAERKAAEAKSDTAGASLEVAPETEAAVEPAAKPAAKPAASKPAASKSAGNQNRNKNRKR
jgi:hypothetical protein